MSTVESRQLYNFIQGSDITGESAYDIWKRLGNEGSEADFLEFIRSGPQGPQGEKGADGEAAYSYFLESSDNVIKKNVDGTLSPEVITFRSFYRIGSDVTKHEYPCKFIIQESTNGTSWISKYTSQDLESSKEYTPSNSDVVMIRALLYCENNTNLLDMQTVTVLSDTGNIEVGARNLFAASNIHYEITKDSTEPILVPINIVNTFDIQRLVGKFISVSYYADTVGSYTNLDDGSQESSNKFGIQATLVWENTSGETVTESPIVVNSVGVNKRRVTNVYEVIAPEGYDTLKDISFEVQLTLKPDSDNDATWVFDRPKLELGNIPTEWIPAPEDIETLVVTLSNEAHVIATDANGANGNYNGCETSVKVYSGTNEVTDRATYEATPSEGLTGTWDEDTLFYTVTELTTDIGYVDIKVSYNGVSVTKRFSLSKTKAGLSGQSTYEIWSELGYEGDANDFLEFMKGEDGVSVTSMEQTTTSTEDGGDNIITVTLSDGTTSTFAVKNGSKGTRGESTYDIWKSLGYEGDADTFLESLKGKDGTSVTILGTKNDESELPTEGNNNGDGYIINGELYVWDGTQWNNVGTIQGPQGERGLQGEAGKSAYETWLTIEGNEGKTEEEFIASLRGPAGKSTYDLWKELGYEGDAQDFLDSLKGDAGTGSSGGAVVDDGQGNITFGSDVTEVISTDAKDSGYDNTNSGLAATNVQDAIDEVANRVVYDENLQSILSLLSVVNGRLKVDEIQIGDAILFWNYDEEELQIKYESTNGGE